MAQCITCPYFDDQHQQCRASPPVTYQVLKKLGDAVLSEPQTVWPSVTEHDWCGKHPSAKHSIQTHRVREKKRAGLYR